eukprot:sb/3477386/
MICHEKKLVKMCLWAFDHLIMALGCIVRHFYVHKTPGTDRNKLTANQNSLFRSRDWLSANQGPVFPDSVGSCKTLFLISLNLSTMHEKLFLFYKYLLIIPLLTLCPPS